MKRILFIAALAIFAPFAHAQAASCICTSGCTIVSDPYPPGAGQPATCTAKIGGSAVGTSAVVLSSSIPTSNATSCFPASATYVPGVAGSVACSVTIPAQSNGTTVTVLLNATNGAGTTADSVGLTFQSVSALPVLPAVPVNVRVR